MCNVMTGGLFRNGIPASSRRCLSRLSAILPKTSKRRSPNVAFQYVSNGVREYYDVHIIIIKTDVTNITNTIEKRTHFYLSCHRRPR